MDDLLLASFSNFMDVFFESVSSCPNSLSFAVLPLALLLLRSVCRMDGLADYCLARSATSHDRFLANNALSTSPPTGIDCAALQVKTTRSNRCSHKRDFTLIQFSVIPLWSVPLPCSPSTT